MGVYSHLINNIDITEKKSNNNVPLVEYVKIKQKVEKTKYENILQFNYFDTLENLPYFLPEDIIKLREETIYSNKSIKNKEYNEWLECYNLYSKGIEIEDKNRLDRWRINKLNELCGLLRLESDIDKINMFKQQILELGWNPEIEFNVKNRTNVTKYTRELLKECANYNIQDLSQEYDRLSENDILYEDTKDIKEIYPIYVVLTYTGTGAGKIINYYDKGIYSHAAISLDSDMKKLYSFNANQFGFSLESIDGYTKRNKDAIMVVYTIFITKSNYTKIKLKIDDLILNKNKTRYSFLNILGLLIGKPISLANDMICSQFVDSILKMVNIDLTKKHSGLVTPNDLYLSLNPKMFKIYEGKINKYDKNKVIKLLKNKYKHDLVLESKQLPIQFDDEGNLLIKNMKKIDFETEYSKSHKLLMNYSKSNNIEGMKYELSKLWFLNILLEKKIYSIKTTDKQKYHKVRARILNDFNKYLKEILKKEQDFIFDEYFNNSPFSDALIKIDGNTIKHTVKILKSIFI